MHLEGVPSDEVFPKSIYKYIIEWFIAYRDGQKLAEEWSKPKFKKSDKINVNNK